MHHLFSPVAASKEAVNSPVAALFPTFIRAPANTPPFAVSALPSL